MSNKRDVLIAFPGGSAPKKLETEATTWGALKTEIKDQFGETFENQKVRDFLNNHHYENDGAVLPTVEECKTEKNPTGILQLLVSTDKNKSGMAINKGNYHKAPGGELRKFCKRITGFGPNGKQLCIDALDKHYGKTSPAAEDKPLKKETVKAVKEAVKEAKPSKKSTIEAQIADLNDRVEALEAEAGNEFLQAARELN